MVYLSSGCLTIPVTTCKDETHSATTKLCMKLVIFNLMMLIVKSYLSCKLSLQTRKLMYAPSGVDS